MRLVLNSWFRVVTAFLITGACYTAYAIMIVPIIEPSENPNPKDTGLPPPPVPNKVTELLKNWFEPDSWELDLPKVFEGTHVENPEVNVRRAREVVVEADRPFAVYADGDHITDLPATVSVLPRALRILAPPA